MPTMSDFRNAIDGLLQSATSLNPLYRLNRNREDSALEVLVFSMCCEAVTRLNGTVELRTIRGSAIPASTFVFRGAPGNIWSQYDDFGYAYCEIGNNQFEIHMNVKCLGTSKANHEIDISFIKSSEADRARREEEHPKSSGVLAAIECKYYTSSDVLTTEGRTFVGLLDDFGQNMQFECFVTNRGSAQLRLYFSLKRRPERFMEMNPLVSNQLEDFINNLKLRIGKWAAV